MKHLLVLALVLFLKPGSLFAQCPPGFSEVIVTIQPDQFPGETSWSLKDLSGTLLAAGGSVGDTLCVPQGICLIFEIRDTYGDGMCCSFGNGFYAVAVNSVIQAAGGQFTFNEYSYINCPPGTHCGSAFTVYEDTLYTSYGASIWHSFTPDSTGTYNVSTCFPSNSCDTRLWIYDHCTGLIWNNDMAGTLFYNDSTCGVQAFIPAGLQVGQTYYIRVGGDTSCSNDSIDWQITYAGPIVGCMDPAACNYNPLASVSNGNCIYPGDPNCNSGPDLIVDGNTLLSSLNMGIVNGNDVCLIGEGCLSGYGARNVINFSTRIANIGDADYYIGQPATGNSQFVFDQCHGHWHYAGYAMYNIYDSLGVPLQAGFKNGFCVLDLQCFGGTAKYGCSNMGISAGCADIYGAGLACQWLDITNVPAGRYTLVVRVNWDQDPDKLGRQEQRFDNNVAAVCINITRDTANVPSFTVLPNCQPIIDCAGDTFGLAIKDCMGNCNGSRVSGDLNIDSLRNEIDVDQYLVDITALNAVMPCNDVNGDTALTVTDAALVSGCIRETSGSHVHPGATQNTHRHCEFPFNIVNTNDTVHLGIGMVNQTLNYIDLNMLNPDCRLLALDFTMSGVVIDSVVSLVGGFYPLIEWNAATGRIALLDTAEVSLGKQLTAMPFVRVYFSTLTSTTVCVASINAAVNADYEETLKSIFNGCVTVTGINILYQSGLVKIIPNPSEGIFAISTDVLNGESANISILDAMGRVIYSSKEVLSAGKGISLDLSKHPKGVYLVRVLTGQLEVTERLVKL